MKYFIFQAVKDTIEDEVNVFEDYAALTSDLMSDC
jgi:hypothetical protein